MATQSCREINQTTNRLKPDLKLLDRPVTERIVSEALELLVNPGVKIGTPEAIELLADAVEANHR